VNLAVHPNIAGVLVVGLGCERFTPEEFYRRIKATGKPVEKVVIQEQGDTLQAIDLGIRCLRKLYKQIVLQKREPIDISEIVIGLECGGTDATSGISANPAIGRTSDALIGLGGTSIFSEVTELLGAEHILTRRCVHPTVSDQLLAVVRKTERELAISTSDPKYHERSALISTGNFQGGVSTVVEKALGNIQKTGRAQIRGVLEFGETVRGKGLFLMDTPGHDGESTTGLVAGGAQIILFSTGRGTPTGFPTAPVIKITGNSQTYRRMENNIDVDAGQVIQKRKTLEEMSRDIFDLLRMVASGRRTKAEVLGHDELFTIPRIFHYPFTCQD
jgi:altronate dehydratase large subunit